MILTTLDWLIIVGYGILTLGVGLYFRQRASQSIGEFFVSGRSLPWWVAGTSMVATTFAADTPLAVTGLTIKYGVAGNWFWWAFAFGGMFTVFVFARLWRRAEVMTDVELVRLRYSGKPAEWLRVIRALYVSLLVNPIIIGWVITAMLQVLDQTVFFDSENPSTASGSAAAWIVILIMMAVVGLYSALSGMWGVAVADVIQFVLAMVGCVWLAVVAVENVGGMDQLSARVNENFGSTDAFRFVPRFDGVDAWMPLHVFLIMLTVQWWATWYPGSEPGGGGYVVQRMASCPDEKSSLKATLLFQLAHYCLRPWPWIIVAFAALALHPELRQNYVADTAFDPGIGFPILMRELSRPGLSGLMTVAFFAAFMSTISTQMNWGASYLVRDVIQPWFKYADDDRKLSRWSQLVSVFVVVEGLAVGYWMNSQNVSVDQAWKFLAALGAGSGLVYMLRWFWWRINAWSEIVAMLASLGWFIVVSNFVIVDSTRSSEIMLLVAVLTMATWLAATFLTAPEPMEKLREFYRKVHPGRRGWQPVAALEPATTPDRDLPLRIFAAVIGSALIFTILPTLGAWIFGDYRDAAILTAATFALGITMTWLVKRLTK
jgi:solute:Na+ symporter, SSS family